MQREENGTRMKRVKKTYTEDRLRINLRQLRFAVAHMAKLLLNASQIAIGKRQISARRVDDGNVKF